ncbi:MAG: hypothetical protein Q7K40_01085 [bacterium]|nr:hypothetical protein [bacterium]
MKSILQHLKVIILAIVLSFGLSYVYAWTAPTATPPSGNVSAPLNTSATSQTKAGPLVVGSLDAGSGSIQTSGTIQTTGYLSGGSVIANSLQIVTGAKLGQSLVSDAAGNLSYTSPAVASKSTTYSTAGTYTIKVPTGLTSMSARLVGGGGGGGGGSDYTRNGAGGGGGAGQVTTLVINGLVAGKSYTLTVGKGGSGGSSVDYPYSNPGQNAEDGGATSISGITGASALGGGKGNNPFNSGGLGIGGSSGGGTSAGATATLSGSTRYGGKGGDCLTLGTGGAAGVTSSNTGTGNGSAATGYCAGGGGGGSNSRPSSGGAGAGGMAVIEFFNPDGVVSRSEWATLKKALFDKGVITTE